MNDYLEQDGAAALRRLVPDVKPIEDRELLGIADLAALFGISTRTIRFYENKGLLSPERVNATRIYRRRDIARLALILRAKLIGSTLTEIRHFLDLYDAPQGGREAQLTYTIQRTGEEIAALEQKLALIQDTLSDLREIHGGSKTLLAQVQRVR